MSMTLSGTALTFNDGTQQSTLAPRAWVNFNGTNGSVAIRTSYNISSVTRNSAGTYTLSFTNSLADANYVVAGTAMYYASVNAHFVALGTSSGGGGTLQTASSLPIQTIYFGGGSASPQDCLYVTVAVFR